MGLLGVGLGLLADLGLSVVVCTDLEVFVAWVTDQWQSRVVVCADLGGLRREARNEEREKKVKIK